MPKIHHKLQFHHSLYLCVSLTCLLICSFTQVPISYQNPCFYADSVSASGSSAIGTLTAPFSNSYSIDNVNYNLFRGILNFDYTPSNNALSYYLSIETKTFTSVSFSISSSYPSSVLSYTIRYIIIDISNFGNNVFFADLNFTSITLSSSNPTYNQRVNPPGGNMFGNGNTPYLYCTLVYVEMIDGTNLNNFGVDTNCMPFNPAKVDITFTRAQDATFQLLGISLMVFDKTYVEAALDVTLQYKYLPFSNSYTLENSFAFPVQPFSSFMGLSGFNSIGVTSVRFNSLIDSSNQQISITNTSNTLNYYYHMNYFNIKDNTLGCPFNFPYQLGITISGACYSTIPTGYTYNPTTGLLVYVGCPTGHYLSSNDTLCYPCLSTCLTCDFGDNCTSCDANNMRQLDNFTHLCVPMTGHYQNGTIIAPPCLSGCASCANETFCLECQTGTNTTLINNECVNTTSQNSTSNSTNSSTVTCSNFCLTCQDTADNCTSCSSTDNRVFNSSTGTCDPSPGYYQNGTSVAPSCSTGCLSCNSSTLCTVCDNTTHRILQNGSCIADVGYYQTPNTTTLLPCNALCQTCQNSSTLCTSCSLSNILINQTCYSCSSLFPDCLTCSPTQCLSCNSSLVLNSTNSCTNCSPACFTCNLLDTNCTSCLSTQYLENGTCFGCPSHCQTCNSSGYCLSCNNGSNFVSGNCVSCQNGEYFDNTSCLACNSTLNFCLSCSNQSVCLSCRNGTYLDLNTHTCIDCNSSINNCILCSSSTNCTTCFSPDYQFDPLSNRCVSVQCGDGILQSAQQCDDGNQISQDGCSNCQIETDWTCDSSSPSLCYYSGTLDISQHTIIKQNDHNSLILVLNLQTGQNAGSIINNLDFNNLININGNQVSINSVDYDSETGTISLVIDYSRDIQGQEFVIDFNPSRSSHTALTLANNTYLRFTATPQNNLLAIYYQPQHYSTAEIVQYATIAISALFFLLFVTSILTGKIIGIEAAAVAQLAFLSLMCLKDMSPSFTELKHGLIVCIYIPLWGNEPSLQVGTPDYLRGMELSRQMIPNFSIDSILILIPILVGIVLLILSVSLLSQKQKQLQPWKQKFIYEYSFHFILFSSYFGFTCLSVQSINAQDSSHSTIGVLSLILGVLFILLVLLYIFLFIGRKPRFGQYSSFFDRKIGLLYVVMVIERGLLGVMIPLFAEYQSTMYPQLIFIAILLLFGITILIKKPYLNSQQTYRQVANYSIAILIQGVYLTPSFASDPKSKVLMYAPLAILALLLICLIYNSILLVKEMLSQYKQMRRKEVGEQEQEEEFAKIRDRMKTFNTTSIVPLMNERDEYAASPVNIMPLQEVLTPGALNDKGKNPLEEVSEQFDNDETYKQAKKRVKAELNNQNLYFSSFIQNSPGFRTFEDVDAV